MTPVAKAAMVAKHAHHGQTDREGLPYWTHCHRVAGNLKAAGYDEDIQAIGWLHDVVEDTSVTLADLADLGFSRRIVDGVEAMTQRAGESLEHYWDRVAENKDAVAVKLEGDIPDNDDAYRASRQHESFYQKQHEKYRRARDHIVRARFVRDAAGGLPPFPPPATTYTWTAPSSVNELRVTDVTVDL